MRQKVIAVAIAGGLAVGAGLIAITVATPGIAIAQDDQNLEGNSERPHDRNGTLLEEVLDDLVATGKITQEQAGDIIDSLAAKATEVRAEREELQELIYGFLDDDVISADELAQLPEGHPFNDPDGPFASALEDGQLTRTEIQSARPKNPGDLKPGGPFKRGARLGALLDDGGIDQAEYDGLSEAHPLKQTDVSQYLEDGVITIDELREIRESQSTSGDAA